MALTDDQTDNIGYGGEKRRQGNRNVLEGKETFRYSKTPHHPLTSRKIDKVTTATRLKA